MKEETAITDKGSSLLQFEPGDRVRAAKALHVEGTNQIVPAGARGEIAYSIAQTIYCVAWDDHMRCDVQTLADEIVPEADFVYPDATTIEGRAAIDALFELAMKTQSDALERDYDRHLQIQELKEVNEILQSSAYQAQVAEEAKAVVAPVFWKVEGYDGDTHYINPAMIAFIHVDSSAEDMWWVYPEGVAGFAVKSGSILPYMDIFDIDAPVPYRLIENAREALAADAEQNDTED